MAKKIKKKVKLKREKKYLKKDIVIKNVRKKIIE